MSLIILQDKIQQKKIICKLVQECLPLEKIDQEKCFIPKIFLLLNLEIILLKIIFKIHSVFLL